MKLLQLICYCCKIMPSKCCRVAVSIHSEACISRKIWSKKIKHKAVAKLAATTTVATKIYQLLGPKKALFSFDKNLEETGKNKHFSCILRRCFSLFSSITFYEICCLKYWPHLTRKENCGFKWFMIVRRSTTARNQVLK